MALQEEHHFTRIFDAPRKLVFRAWTNADLLAQWWGPAGFTAPFCKIDAEPGGAIRIDMKAPDGRVYPMKGVVREARSPERLVFTSAALEDPQGNPALEVLNTVTFLEQDGKTKMNLQAVVIKAAPEADESLEGMDEGWKQSLQRLDNIFSTLNKIMS
jgi:uncharacterized protein YndB with AHSA1/START domain